MGYHSAIKMGLCHSQRCRWIRDCHKEKNKYHILTHMRTLERWYRWIYFQNRNRVKDVENKLMVTKARRRED